MVIISSLYGRQVVHPFTLKAFYLETLIAILKNSARDSVFNHFIELVQQVGHFSSQNDRIERLLLPIALSEIRDQKKRLLMLILMLNLPPSNHICKNLRA